MKTPESVLERYVTAVKTMDKQALLALYAPTVRFFDMSAPFELRGLDVFAQRVESWFTHIEGSVPDAEGKQAESATSGDLAYMTMLMDFSDLDDEGVRRTMLNRLTWVMALDGDDWKIIHEHTSVPLNEDTMQPEFQQ